MPQGYGKAVLKDKTARLTVIADKGLQVWTTVEAEVFRVASRLDSAIRTASILDAIDSERMPLRYAFRQDLAAWDEPPIAVKETTSTAVKKTSGNNALAHNSPGMALRCI